MMGYGHEKLGERERNEARLAELEAKQGTDVRLFLFLSPSFHFLLSLFCPPSLFLSSPFTTFFSNPPFCTLIHVSSLRDEPLDAALGFRLFQGVRLQALDRLPYFEHVKVDM